MPQAKPLSKEDILRAIGQISNNPNNITDVKNINDFTKIISNEENLKIFFEEYVR